MQAMKLRDTGVARCVDEEGSSSLGGRAALEALLADADAMASLHRTAERYARVHRGSWEAADLVWDVIGDLTLGDLTCDPSRPLGPQLEQEVRRHANRWRRGKRPQREPPQPVLVDLERAPTSALALEAPHEGQEVDQSIDPEELVSRVRERASRDPAAQQLLALYERNIVSRRDALNSGMTEWMYRSARERLAVYAAMAAEVGVGTSAAPTDGAAEEAALPVTRAIGLSHQTARLRRAVSHTVGQRRKPRST